MKSTRNKGELDLGDLPPIEDLQISVPEDQCLPVGKILNIVDTLGKFYYCLYYLRFSSFLKSFYTWS